MGNYLDAMDEVAESSRCHEEMTARGPLLTRQAFCQRFGLSPHELDLLLRRPDFVSACCLTSEGGSVTRLVPGRFERWLEGRGEAADAARTPTWVALLAVVARAYLRAVARPGGIEEVA